MVVSGDEINFAGLAPKLFPNDVQTLVSKQLCTALLKLLSVQQTRPFTLVSARGKSIQGVVMAPRSKVASFNLLCNIAPSGCSDAVSPEKPGSASEWRRHQRRASA